MGEYVGLCIGNYEFLSCKNSFGDLLSIYSPDDLNIEEVFDLEINDGSYLFYYSKNPFICLYIPCYINFLCLFTSIIR